MALLHSARDHWAVRRGGSRQSLPCRSRVVSSIRTLVAKPLSAAVPADKGAVAVQPGTNGQPTGNEYIAGPYGSGRLSTDGECKAQGALIPEQHQLALDTTWLTHAAVRAEILLRGL